MSTKLDERFTYTPYEEDFKKNFENVFPSYKDMIRIHPGEMAVPGVYKRFHRQYQDFKLQESDVWVCTFPKTGTTWLQEMIWGVIFGIDDESIKVSVEVRYPFFDIDLLMPENAMELDFFKSLPADDPSIPGNTWKILQSMTPPRYIKSHLPLSLNPQDILKTTKVAYICRDPKDVVVSYYFFLKKYHDYVGELPRFVDLFLEDAIPYCPYWKHVLPFWEQRNSPNLLFLRYEEMKEDLSGCIQKAASFFGKTLTSAEVSRLCSHLSFSSMRNNPAVNHEVSDVTADIKFMRKGQVGDYKNHLTEDQIQRFDAWTKKNLEGSDFPYYK